MMVSLLWTLVPAVPSDRVAYADEKQPGKSPNSRVRLDNGITVLIHAVPDVDQIAVEAFYEVGFMHEPKGMTQAAHLLEHLVCNAATATHAPGAAMTLLSTKGFANAETLPAFTHYDYAVPSADLELVLQIEAARLASLKITREIILQESPRCYQEADFVEANPRAGMLKHAFMALSQGWRHGVDRALIRGGMEDFAIADLHRFHREYYRPDRLTLVLIGDLERDNALGLIRKHLGAVTAPPPARPQSIDWKKQPPMRTVEWDSKLSAVCVAFAPPAAQADRIVLALWGSANMQRFASDPELSSLADAINTSNHLWNPGELPIYVYASCKPGVSPDKLATAMKRRIKSIVSEGASQGSALQIQMFARQLANPLEQLSRDQIDAQIRMLMAQGMAADEKSAMRMILGQSALNWGVAERLFGPSPAANLKKIAAMTPQQIQGLATRFVNVKTCFVTVLVPQKNPK
jgi:predicted Zn-dependent peptidase